MRPLGPLVRLGARLVVLVVLLQLVFVGLLVVGATVPDKPIVDRLSADARSGAYGPSGQPDGQGGRATSFTDCVAAGTGLGLPTTSAFDRAIRMPRLESCTEGSGSTTRRSTSATGPATPCCPGRSSPSAAWTACGWSPAACSAWPC